MAETLDSFDWNELAFGNKKPINGLNATFIGAPREMSHKRIAQLLKQYLPDGNVVIGIAKEDYVDGFENQPQYQMLQYAAAEPIIKKVHAAKQKHNAYILHYFQRDAKYILEKLKFRKVVFINGSWKQSFHTRDTYYTLANKHIPYELVSPFTDEDEARDYEKYASREAQKKFDALTGSAQYSEIQMMDIAKAASHLSYDHTYQTGVALGKKRSKTYKLIEYAYNNVVPYQTYAMHFGYERERHFSPPGELNFYDTNHAEVAFLIKAQQKKLDLKGATLFITTLPCPTCCRMLSGTDIKEFVYELDHSDGYAIGMFERSGKNVRRILS